ncbi:hypothetical protein B0H13DRAFT_2356157 [Mycena leptocephala]|nr:hypothetical protein B0H13DRAFT_2356157 [Mycena leptocephala]
MLTHTPHTSEVFLGASADGRRAIRSVLPVLATPNIPLAQPGSEYYQEDLATNAALESHDFNYTMGDISLQPEIQELSSNEILFTGKKKRYENSDFPFKTFVRNRDDYLDEMLRLEGRGDADNYSACHGCGALDPIYRCAHQTCYGASLFCSACIVKHHTLLPTHWIETWNGTFFERQSLASLGLVIQLGHPSGFSCPTATAGHKNFALIDVTGLMRARWWPATVTNPQTCATFAVVRLFQIMNCLGKVSAHDFMRSLELLTNNDGLHPVPILRRSFRHIIRQYCTTLMMKRAGRGHDLSGVNGTKQGELALQCRACPQDGMNVPPRWDRIDWAQMSEDLRYKYFLFLAQDCNFRLINRDVSSAAKDPIIGDGLGYFVNNEQYAAYLREHVTEEEISSCSGFQAMFLANKKRVKGHRTTGVGGVTCAAIICGERTVLETYSWVNGNAIWTSFWLQQEILGAHGGLPSSLVFVLDKLRVWFKVPNFHLPPHKPPCHAPFSFHWMWGAGRTHGETVEQNWEFTNGAAASMKMMGMGARDAMLEDLFGFHNWRRLVSWHGTSRCVEAFDAALRVSANTMMQGWQDWVHDWESRQHTTGAVSPFEMKEKDGRFLKRRANLLKRIRAFRKMQRTYMPNLRRFLTMAQHVLWDTEADREAENIHLFMPSDIADRAKRVQACAEGLPSVEGCARHDDEPFPIAELDGPAGAYAGQGILRQVNLKIHKAKLRYRYARNALLRLLDHGGWEKELEVLKDEDVRALNERALTEEERAQRETVHDLADVAEEGGVASFGVVALGETRRTLSWIWYATKTGDDPTEAELVEALRVEWCKVYARSQRWWEDTVLVDEEMGRTIEYVEAPLEEGLLAYATEQAARERQTCAELERKWAGLRMKGRAFVAGVSTATDRMGEADTITVEADEDDDGDDEERAPDYGDEDEEDVLE